MTDFRKGAPEGMESTGGSMPLERFIRSPDSEAYTGMNIMAAATAAGMVHLCDSDDGSPRGIFCGMGVCGECTVALADGRAARACMSTCGSAAGPLPLPSSEDRIETPDLLVIGGGPAGLAAARAAALHGVDVVLLDERDHLGGQYFKQRSVAAPNDRPRDAQMIAGANLIGAVERLGVRIHTQAIVWGAFRPLELAVVLDGQSVLFRPKRLILATGAFERAVPMPGWTLPGVMTTGAAQTLLRSHGLAAGKRILIAGNGPLNFQLAHELIEAGANVVAVAETAPRPGLRSVAATVGMLNAPALAARGLGYVARILNSGAKIHYGSILTRIEGETCARRAYISRLDAAGSLIPGSAAGYDADLVCMGFGLQPASELARLLGCEQFFDPVRGTFVVRADADGATSVPGVAVAGDGGGMVGAQAALAQGWIAGCAAAQALGRDPTGSILSETSRQRRRLRRHEQFQASLWQLFRGPRLHHQLADQDTRICRCENVTLAEIVRELDGGITTVGALKRATRAGMGRCQGRYCGPVLANLLAEKTQVPVSDALTFAPRPPVRPVPVGAIGRPQER